MYGSILRSVRHSLSCYILTMMICWSICDGKTPTKIEAFFQGRCSLLSPCHQLCIDLETGGYECACTDGFILQLNGFSCSEQQLQQSSAGGEIAAHTSYSNNDNIVNNNNNNNNDDDDNIESKTLLRKPRADVVTSGTLDTSGELGLDVREKSETFDNTFTNNSKSATSWYIMSPYETDNGDDYINPSSGRMRYSSSVEKATKRPPPPILVFGDNLTTRTSSKPGETKLKHSLRDDEYDDEDEDDDENKDDDGDDDDDRIETGSGNDVGYTVTSSHRRVLPPAAGMHYLAVRDNYVIEIPATSYNSTAHAREPATGSSLKVQRTRTAMSRRRRRHRREKLELLGGTGETENGMLWKELTDQKLQRSGGYRHRSALRSDLLHTQFGEDSSAETSMERPFKTSSSFTSCSDVHCSGGGWCVQQERDKGDKGEKGGGGVRCRCPLGTTGTLCERDLAVKYPKFSGAGFIAFPVLRGAHKEFTLVVEFRPESRDGLLLFSADHPNAKFDFFSLGLVNGHLEFRFDCGSGMATIRSHLTVDLSSWNNVTVYRNEWNAWIQLNNGIQTVGKSKGKFSRINFREHLYLGGYVNVSRITDRIGLHRGFTGCVRLLQVNDKVYDMRRGAFIGDAIHGMDVGDCNADVCLETRCMNGGTCVPSGAGTSECLCPMGVVGTECEERVTIAVPMFNGTSFLQFIGLQRTVLSYTEVEIVVKPMDLNGLIFYNGYAKDRTGDFISLTLNDGFVEYRFDLGTGSALIRRITLNEWHIVRFSRTGRNGFLKVDNQELVEGMSSGAFTQLTLLLDLFIGGHRNFDEVAKSAQIGRSFKGCIQKVTINKRPMRLLEEAMTGVNVNNCIHPCVRQPCLNLGRCVPINDDYRCSCPLGFANTNCEDKSDDSISVPKFSGDSFLMFQDSIMMQRTRGKSIDVEMRVKASSADGLLFWVSEEETSLYSDYLSIGLKDGHVQFSYNLGSGEVMIVHNKTRVDDHKWHTIKIHRLEKDGTLEIDGSEDVAQGISPGGMKHLTTHGIIYIGGMDDIVHGTLHKYTSGFVGCISNVTLDKDYLIDLMKAADEGGNISQCSGSSSKRPNRSASSAVL